MVTLWPLVVLCVVLLIALSLALREVYNLKLHSSAVAPTELQISGKPTGGDLARLIPQLQDYVISGADTASREEFCNLFVEKVCRFAGADRGIALLWDEEESMLRQIAACGNGSADSTKADLASDETVKRVFESGKAEFSGQGSGRRTATLPLKALSKPLGVLWMDGIDQRHRDSPDLSILSGEAAAIIHHLNLFDRLQTFHLEMVETLYRTVNARDGQASAHAEQTRQRTSRLARAMKLPESTVRHVEYAALLRGVGKIGVDQAILNKPGKLTTEEYEKIKKYTTIGHDLLQRVKLLAPAAKMVLHHQEWYNGQGYPEGLKGEEIPIGARIIAVISAWEAMRTDRPYRKALDVKTALGELARGSGTQFDPAVVQAFSKLEETSQ